jgi:hypothetical protein
MKFFTRCLIIVCAFTVSLFVVPGASADDWNKKTIVTFSQPVEVPGVGAQVLPAGTYVFKLVDSPADRNIVQILNKQETHVFTTILAIANYRLRTTDKTVMTFKERAQGEPEAIRAWFYPGHQWGQEFVYPKSKAVELAKVSNEPVLYMPEVATVEDLKTVRIEAVKPTGEAIPVAEVIQAPPVEVAKLEEPATLPKTGSDLPLLACMGLLSLGAAIVTKKYTA